MRCQCALSMPSPIPPPPHLFQLRESRCIIFTKKKIGAAVKQCAALLEETNPHPHGQCGGSQEQKESSTASGSHGRVAQDARQERDAMPRPIRGGHADQRSVRHGRTSRSRKTMEEDRLPQQGRRTARA